MIRQEATYASCNTGNFDNIQGKPFPPWWWSEFPGEGGEISIPGDVQNLGHSPEQSTLVGPALSRYMTHYAFFLKHLQK